MPPGTLESGDKTGGHRQQNYTTWEPLGGALVFLQGPRRGDFLQEWGSVGSWVEGRAPAPVLRAQGPAGHRGRASELPGDLGATVSHLSDCHGD